MTSSIQKTGIPPKDESIERARQSISEHFSRVPVRLDGPITVRDYSEIYHAIIDSDPPLEAAIKRCLVLKTKAPDVTAAGEQFDALERVSKALQATNEFFRVPTPLCLVPEEAIFAMSWLKGKSLTKLLHHPSVFINGTAWFEQVGAWLGNFHASGPIRRQPLCLDERLKGIEGLSHSPLSHKSFSKAVLTLKETAPAFSKIEIDASWLHGDCKTDNFIVDGKSVFGIDIGLNYENFVELDLAQFLNNLDLLLCSPQFIHVSWMRNRFANAFRRGYRSTGINVSDSYLSWLRLNLAISLWHDRITGKAPGIRTTILNKMFVNLVNRLLQTFE